MRRLWLFLFEKTFRAVRDGGLGLPYFDPKKSSLVHTAALEPTGTRALRAFHHARDRVPICRTSIPLSLPEKAIAIRRSRQFIGGVQWVSCPPSSLHPTG